MIAKKVYDALNRAGLTPPVHYAAAPHEWREALRGLDDEFEIWVCQEFDRLSKKQPSTNTGTTLLELLEMK